MGKSELSLLTMALDNETRDIFSFYLSIVYTMNAIFIRNKPLPLFSDGSGTNCLDGYFLVARSLM